jgi:hypothetical protein
MAMGTRSPIRHGGINPLEDGDGEVSFPTWM